MGYRDDYEAKYGVLRETRTIIKGDLLNKLKKKCQENAWLKIGGVDFEDDPMMELDYEYCLCEYTDIAMLRLFFEHGNWAIRQGVKYKDLIFVNQVNGGDEWWAVKISPEGELFPFDSITMRAVMKWGDQYFNDYINGMVSSSVDMCVSLTYTTPERPKPFQQDN